VNSFTPVIHVSAQSNTPGSALSISGTGFASGEKVTFTLGSATSSSTADSSGSANGSLVIPSIAAGTYAITGTGQTSGALGMDFFYVGTFYPNAFPSSYYAIPGQTISFSGSGFGSSETINLYVASSGTQPIANFTSDASGGFKNAGSSTVPFSAAGTTLTFRLLGQTSRVSVDLPVSIGQLFPSATPSDYYVSPGTSLSFSGTGFAPGETIAVTTPGSGTMSSFSADSAGNFSQAGAFTVPFGFAGSTRDFTLTGQTSGAKIPTSVTFGNFYPSITPSSYFVLPGQAFTLAGTGFAPSEQIAISINGSSTAISPADKWGGFSGVAFTAPYLSNSILSVAASGISSHASATVPVAVGGLYPVVNPNSYYLAPGDAISFSGTGFAPGETINVAHNAITLTTIAANASGSFSGASTSIPISGSGDFVFLFKGNLSGASFPLTVTIAQLFPVVVSDIYYAQPGTTARISGTGFAKGENVRISINSSPVGTTSANSMGNVDSFPVTIPFGTQTAVVKMTGASTGASGQTSIAIASFYPSVTPSTYYTAPGSSVNFSGTGFAANESVSILLNGKAAGSATTTSAGSFSATTTIPVSATSARYDFSGSLSGASVGFDIGLAALHPWILLGSYWANGGTPWTVNGYGFAAGEAVTLSMDGTSFATSTADGSGNFVFSGNVPFGSPGDKTISATGGLSGASATSPFTMAPVWVDIRLESYAGAPGTPVTFMGSGYFPNETIQITTDRTGSSPVYTFSTDARGAFHNSGYVIPSSFAGGALTISIKGNHSMAPKDIVYWVTGP
jgi:hypothetical protein